MRKAALKLDMIGTGAERERATTGTTIRGLRLTKFEWRLFWYLVNK